MGHPRKRVRRLPIIGVTGGVGTGKSLLASLFAEWGGFLISGDEIGNKIVDESAGLRRKLVSAFGPDILAGGRVRRSVLAQKAFSSRECTELLNRLVHPPLLRELNRQIDRAARSRRFQAVIVDAALLTEWGRHRVRCDWLVGVWAPLYLRKRRLRRRGWSDDQIQGRMRGQMPWESRRKMVDCIVKNDDSVTTLKRRARLCWEKVVSCH